MYLHAKSPNAAQRCVFVKSSLSPSTLSIWQMVTNTSSALMLSCFCSFILLRTNTVEYLHCTPDTWPCITASIYMTFDTLTSIPHKQSSGQITLVIFMTCQEQENFTNCSQINTNTSLETYFLAFYRRWDCSMMMCCMRWLQLTWASARGDHGGSDGEAHAPAWSAAWSSNGVSSPGASTLASCSSCLTSCHSPHRDLLSDSRGKFKSKHD